MPEFKPLDHDVKRLEDRLQRIEGLARMGGRDFVLHGDMGHEALTILRGERMGPALRDAQTQRHQLGRIDDNRHAIAGKAQPACARREGLGLPAALGQLVFDLAKIAAGQCMKQCQVGWYEIAGGGKIGPAHRIETRGDMRLQPGGQDEGRIEDRR